MKKIVLVGFAVFLLMPIVIAQSSYYSFKDCDLYSYGTCEDFSASYENKEMEFRARINPYSYSVSNADEYIIESIAITKSSYDYSTGTYKSDVCANIAIGAANSGYAGFPFDVKREEWFYVRATGCDLRPNEWLDATLTISYRKTTGEEVAAAVSPQGSMLAEPQVMIKPQIGTQQYITGRIRKFIATEDYRRQQMLNRYVYRFIPIIVIAFFSLLGLIRVRR